MASAAACAACPLSRSWPAVSERVARLLSAATVPPAGCGAGDEYAAGVVSDRIKRVMEHTVPGGKLMRGRLVVDAAAALGLDRPQPSGADDASESISLVDGLAWAVEMLQAFLLVYDDIMDGAALRRGRPAWHTVEGVGLAAVNDGLLMETAVDALVAHVADGHPAKESLLAAFRETKQTVSAGQLLDMTSEGQTATFTSGLYGTMARCKTSHYSVFLPLQLAIVAAGRLELLADTRRLAYAIGEYFQVQDDYLDVYGGTATAKSSGDIDNGKCTWLVCTAIDVLNERGNADALALLKKHYGRKSSRSHNIVLDVFDGVKLRAIYAQYEEDKRVALKKMVDECGDYPLAPVLEQLINKLYKRSK